MNDDPTRTACVVTTAADAERAEREFGRAAAKGIASKDLQRHQILAVLISGTDLERRKALTLLYYLDDDAGRQAILTALDEDPSPIVRHEAAFYAGACGHKGAIEPLLKALREDPNELVRHEAAEALGDMSADVALPALRAIAEKDHSELVAATARVAIEQLLYGGG